METNNTRELKPSDLFRPIGQLLREVMSRPGRMGWPRLSYCDAHDAFQIVLIDSTQGISVSIRLNNQQAYQLNNRRFNPQTPLGLPMLIACGTELGVGVDVTDVIRSFFDVVEG